MKAQVVDDILRKHPYYKKLTSAEKIVVLNLATQAVWEKLNTEVLHAVYPKGSIGFDNSVFNPDAIYKLPQGQLEAKSLSSFDDLDIDLSSTDFLKEFSKDERLTIYKIAVGKVSKELKSLYEVVTIPSNTQKSIFPQDRRMITIDYTIVPIIVTSLYGYAPRLTITNLDPLSFTSTLYSYNPKVVITYTAEHRYTSKDMSKTVVTTEVDQGAVPNVRYAAAVDIGYEIDKPQALTASIPGIEITYRLGEYDIQKEFTASAPMVDVELHKQIS